MNRLKEHRTALVLLAVSLVFLLTGTLLRGEHEVVLEKAIRICLECIGIG
ncbi:MAG: hypothetical protein IJ468_03455 [Lachnospiraceae bacterium]|nr:hypothetical protein [Lachnospiraceae bacterium]